MKRGHVRHLTDQKASLQKAVAGATFVSAAVGAAAGSTLGTASGAAVRTVDVLAGGGSGAALGSSDIGFGGGALTVAILPGTAVGATAFVGRLSGPIGGKRSTKEPVGATVSSSGAGSAANGLSGAAESRTCLHHIPSGSRHYVPGAEMACTPQGK